MRWLGALALPIAVIALFMSLRQPEPALHAPATAPLATPDTTALQTRLTALQAHAAALQVRVDALEARPSAAASASLVMRRIADDAAPNEAPSSVAPSRVLSVDAPGVTVEERGGSLQVTNRNPALTGQTLRLEARDEDGATKMITIMVPAPE